MTSSLSCDLLLVSDFDRCLPSSGGMIGLIPPGLNGSSLIIQLLTLSLMLSNSSPPPGALQYLLLCGGILVVPLNPQT